MFDGERWCSLDQVTARREPRGVTQRQTVVRRVLALTLAAAGCVACSRSGATAETPTTPQATATSGIRAGAVASEATLTTTASTPADTASDAIRVETADGCPPTVHGHGDNGSTAATWITNPDSQGLSDTFVPDTPTGALICRYTALDTVTTAPDGRQLEGGSLYSSTTLDGSDAQRLAAALNDVAYSSFTAACVPPADKARYTALTFALPERRDVNVWLKDWIECPEVSNGIHTSGQLINGHGSAFLAHLDSVAPPAPEAPYTGAG